MMLYKTLKQHQKQSLNKIKDQSVSASLYESKVKSIVQKQSINKNRAYTAERNKISVMSRVIDTSKD